VSSHAAPPFDQLDFLYTPSRDVASDMAYFTDVLGGHVLFAIEAIGTRVAAIELTSGPPVVLLTDHVPGDRAILVYRVSDLVATLSRQEAAGWVGERTFDIPHGPCCSFVTPGGHRVALYQRTRPDAAEHFEGRLDF
jgi:hypothetical protein